MTTEQKLIKDLIDAADNYSTSAEYQPDPLETKESKEWKEAFNRLREYADQIPAE